jgi:hypothetical protein
MFLNPREIGGFLFINKYMSNEEPDNSFKSVISNFIDNFINEEVSAQTRMKLSRIAKRTAPRRKIVRAMRAKKRKSLIQLKVRAKNRIKDVLRHRVYKGNWKKLSLSQRAQIDKSINKKKKIIGKMVQRIMPEVIRGESQRLRNLNSSFEPWGNFIFEGEEDRREPNETQKKVRREQNKVNKRRQRERDSNKRQAGDTANAIMVIKDNTNGEVRIIDKESYNANTHEVLVPADKATTGNVEKYLKNPNFVNTKTSIELFGLVRGDSTSGSKEKKQEGSEQVAQEAPIQKIPATKKSSRSDTFATSHGAGEMEGGIVYVINSMMGLTPEQMVQKGLLPKEMIDSIINNPNESFLPSCQRAAQRMVSAFGNLHAKMTGRNKRETILTQEAKNSGVRDRTPRSDIILVDPNTNQPVMTASIKVGKSQLASGGPAETASFLKWTMKQFNDQMSEESTKEIEDFIKLFSTEMAGNFRTSSGPVTLFQTGGSKFGQDELVLSREQIHTKATELLRSILTKNRKFASMFVYALLTGSGKFEEGNLGIATHIISVNRDGTDAKLTPITQEYADKILDQIDFRIRFKSSSATRGEQRRQWKEFVQRKKELGEEINPEEDWRSYSWRSVMSAVHFLPENKVVFNFMKTLLEAKKKDEAFEQGIVPDPTTPEEAKQYLKDAFDYIGNDSFKLFQFFEGTIDYDINQPIVDWPDAADNPGSRVNTIYINGQQIEVPVEDPYDYELDGSMTPELKEERNYRKEYDNYHSKPEQRANRSKRVLARRLMMKLGKVKKGDGKDVDHKDGNPQNNGKHNLRVRNKSDNRSDNK